MIKKLLDWLYYFFELSANHNTLFTKMYIKFHTYSVKKEIEMAGLKKEDKILHIGCGSIPYTLIILSNVLKTKVFGIDNNQKVVENARNLIKKFEKYDSIMIDKADGDRYDISSFNVIIISYGINQLDLVLKHVTNSAYKKSKVIIRRPNLEKNKYLDKIIEKYYKKKIRSLLTQDSILLVI